MPETPQELLRSWLGRQLAPAQFDWLCGQLEKVAAEPSLRNIQVAFGLVPRRLGKDDLSLAPDDLAAAGHARSGWDPTNWSVDVAARVLVLTSAGDRDGQFADKFVNLCRYADVAEAIALYSGLPLYPNQAELEPQVGEGLRTNMRSVFEAVAHRSPYPMEQFDENRWNHMVLKALFVDSRLAPIQGLEKRANPELARILLDYAHERRAASRPITPELWRCVGPFAGDTALEDLEQVLAEGSPIECRAAALALSASSAPRAAFLLSKHPTEVAAIDGGELTWDKLAEDL